MGSPTTARIRPRPYCRPDPAERHGEEAARRTSHRLDTVAPATGQEIRLIAGPLFVDHPYRLEREVIALSESARTESMWIRTRAFDGETGVLVAEMILNHAVMKASYAAYDRELAELTA